MMPAQKTEQYRDELRSSRVEMLQHEDMNMTMHSTITIHEDGPRARLSEAWQWLDAQCNDAPDSADIWHVRHRHATDGAYLTDLLHALQSGRYRLSPMQLYGEGENKKAMWGAQDALVLKWVALCIQPLLPLHLSCEHVKGHGGGKQSVGKPHDLLTRTYTGEMQHDDSPKKTDGYRWVCRTDIRGYYRHINKERLFAQVKQHVSDPVMRDLVHQYLHYTVEDGGTFHTPETGISRGCALSPLMGALHLYDMDAHFSAQKNIHYARYMDDVIILAKSRWSLRRHTKRLMQWFAEYGFEAHPDKTQIGRTEKGFDWLGAWLTHEGVTDIAPRAKANHREKVRRLYEQLARVPKWLRHRRQQQVHARVSTYRKRWHIWAGALMLCSGVCLAADRPIVVLAGTLPAGINTLPGGVFHTLASASPQNKDSVKIVNTNIEFALVNVTGTQVDGSCGATDGGLKWCDPVGDGTYGVKVTGRGLYLVPVAGHVAARLGNLGGIYEIDPSQPAGVNCPSSLWGGATVLLGCNPASWRELAAYMPGQPDKDNMNRGCDGTRNSDDPLGKLHSVCYGFDIDVSLSPVCVDCTPGSTNITALAARDYIFNTNVQMDKPTAIVVSGLSCNLSSPTNGLALIDTSVSTREGAGTAAGVATLQLSVSCTGTNVSGANVPVGLQVNPSGSTQADGEYQLVDPNQPSFYSTISKDAADCATDGSNTNKLKIGQQYSNPVRTYASNEVGKSDPLNLVWALCSTGNATQSPGQYTMTATASIVSY